MPEIKITITNKKAAVEGAPVIICGNSDYMLKLTLAAEWSAVQYKTARFVYVQNGQVLHEDVDFTGSEVKVPKLLNTTQVKVGIFAGELYTSTPAVIPCQSSILCNSGAPADPTPEEDARIMALLNLAIKRQADAEAAASKAEDALASHAPAIVQEASGTNITVADSADALLRGLRIFGKSTQEGTPTPDAPVDIVNLASGGRLVVDVDGQKLTLSTPEGLPGVPVTDASLANYTDADGQKWVADEVDLGRGVYVQRVAKVYFSYPAYTELNPLYTSKELRYWRDDMLVKSPVFSTKFKSVGNTWGHDETYIISSGGSEGKDVCLRVPVSAGLDYLVTNPMHAMFILAEPIETALTAEDIAAFAALHSNKPNTTILNDAEAHMEVKYVADTKTYIDNKFKELQAQLLSN